MITFLFLSKPDLQAIVFMKHWLVFLVLAILGIRRNQYMIIYLKAIGLNTGEQMELSEWCVTYKLTMLL